MTERGGRWDAIVVGAGTSGSVVAALLSEDPSRRVLVLEAGPVPTSSSGLPRRLLDAGLVPGAAPRTAETSRYPAALTRDGGADFHVTRGRMLGGSSAINGAAFVRPRPEDFARWATAGLPWDHDTALPAMRRLERDLDLGASALHGDAGPIPVHRTPLDHPIGAAFRDAALDAGHPWEADKNAPGEPGIGPLPRNVEHGRRVQPGDAYLLAARDRGNLVILGEAPVIGLAVDGGRVVGVRYAVEGAEAIARADEVVLCAGPVESTHLLLLAGIGPAVALRRAGLPVRLDAPGVGTAFADHPQVVLEWAPPRPAAAPAGEWTAGVLHAGSVELLQGAKPLAALGGDRTEPTGPLPLLVTDLAPRSTGRLVLDPADPRLPPRLDYGYLADDAARCALREGVRLGLELIRAMGGVLVSGPASTSGRDVDAWVRAHLTTAFHSCGTVPIGGPLDAAGRLRGIDGLRVADTSVLPDAPSRGPALAAVLVGELLGRGGAAADQPRT
ncbi:MAG: hypothetical protein BGO95_10135 [Micrococcales bacterium 73-13]|nr:MAG: hypothetical protein BGO95_10135 [Micrococcales bacterium 73-13]